MAPAAMMEKMDAGMAATPLMPASTPPAAAMRGYDLGPAVELKGSIAFDSFRCAAGGLAAGDRGRAAWRRRAPPQPHTIRAAPQEPAGVGQKCVQAAGVLS